MSLELPQDLKGNNMLVNIAFQTKHALQMLAFISFLSGEDNFLITPHHCSNLVQISALGKDHEERKYLSTVAILFGAAARLLLPKVPMEL
jgi:hypothetical protein